MPTIILGDCPGGVGNHKDTQIYSAAVNASYGDDVRMSMRLFGGFINTTVCRWDLTLLPANATIVSAIASFFKQDVAGVPSIQNLSFHNLLTDFGVTRINEGVAQNPPVGANDAATWTNPFAVTGTNWAGGGVFSAADYTALAFALQNTNVGDAVDKEYQVDFLPAVNLWFNNDATNNGFIIRRTDNVNNFVFWHTREAVNPLVRPCLTIQYTVPSTGTTRQSHTAISNTIAIM